MEKHKLDQLFSNQLGDLEVSPNEDAWSQIADTLDAKNKKPVWIWVGVAASAILTVFSSYYFLVAGEEMENQEYAYMSGKMITPELPQKLVYVPVFIQPVPVVEAPAVKTKVNTYQPSARQVAVVSEPVRSFQTQIMDDDNVTIVALEEVPVITKEEVLMASAAEVSIAEPEQKQLPVTIIYKQGEPEEESNFTKAINYMEDVRMGEKKLVDFQKLRKNIKSKFKSNKDVNTK